MIFGVTLVSTFTYIYGFAYTTLGEDDGLALVLLLSIYVGVCGFVLLIVTSVCLCLHFRKRQLVLWLGPLGAFDKLHKKTKRVIEKCLWLFLLSSTLACFASLWNSITVTYAGRLELALKGTRYELSASGSEGF